MEFTYDFKGVGDFTAELKLSGYLDESARLPDDLKLSSFKSFYVDFGDVEFINSGGIKLWVNFLDQLQEHPDVKVYYRKCRRMIVEQINLIDSFLPKNGEVLSLYTPVFCKKCEGSFEIFLDIKNLNEELPFVLNKVKPASCSEFPKCRKYFELDIDTDQFFRFLKN